MLPLGAPEVAPLLLAWSQGDETSLNQLIPVVYRELRRLAHRYMSSERPGSTLQTTILIHETYRRLVESPKVQWQDHSHFLAACAQLMRRILVDYARARHYQKRGGGFQFVSLNAMPSDRIASRQRARNLVALDDALTALAALDLRKSQVVELRFFGGLTVEETAAALNISSDTALRDWKLAKVWLLRELGGLPDDTRTMETH